MYGTSVCPLRFPTRTLQHAPIGSLRDGIDVGWHLVALLAPVHFHDLLRVDGQVLVRVDDHAEKPRIGLSLQEKEGG